MQHTDSALNETTHAGGNSCCSVVRCLVTMRLNTSKQNAVDSQLNHLQMHWFRSRVTSQRAAVTLAIYTGYLSVSPTSKQGLCGSLLMRLLSTAQERAQPCGAHWVMFTMSHSQCKQHSVATTQRSDGQAPPLPEAIIAGKAKHCPRGSWHPQASPFLSRPRARCRALQAEPGETHAIRRRACDSGQPQHARGRGYMHACCF